MENYNVVFFWFWKEMQLGNEVGQSGLVVGERLFCVGDCQTLQERLSLEDRLRAFACPFHGTFEEIFSLCC